MTDFIMFEDKDIKQIILPSNHRLGYFDYGEGKPIVMLHGFPDTAKIFRHQAAAFNRSGYRLVCPYLPGYEYSSAPHNQHFFLFNIAQILSEFLDHLFPHQEIMVIGHDWGGYILRFLQIFHSRGETSYRLPGLIYIAIAISPAAHRLLNRKIFPGLKQFYQSRYVLYFQFEQAVRRIKNNDLRFIKKLWRSWSHNIKENDSQLQDVLELLAQNQNLANAINYYRYNVNLNLTLNKLISTSVRSFC